MIGTRVGRVKVIFKLPTQLKLIGTHKTAAPSYWPTTALAYVEWFTPPTLTIQQRKVHNMASVNRSAPQLDGSLLWSIIPLINIRQSCMLMPNFGASGTDSQSSWTSSNVLDSASSFLVNNWSSVNTYKTIYHD